MLAYAASTSSLEKQGFRAELHERGNAGPEASLRVPSRMSNGSGANRLSVPLAAAPICHIGLHFASAGAKLFLLREQKIEDTAGLMKLFAELDWVLSEWKVMIGRVFDIPHRSGIRKKRKEKKNKMDGGGRPIEIAERDIIAIIIPSQTCSVRQQGMWGKAGMSRRENSEA